MDKSAQKSRIRSEIDKKYAVEQVLHKNKSVSKVARELGVARKTIYFWIKRYKETSPRNKGKAFKTKYVIGKSHPRAVYPKARHTLIRLIFRYPDWGCRKYSKELKKKGIDLGYYSVHQFLKEISASTPELRENLKRNYSGPGRLEADIKLEIIRKVLEEKVPISIVSTQYGVARKTIYQWIKRYQVAEKEGIIGVAGLREAYVSSESHPRAIYPKVEAELLAPVSS